MYHAERHAVISECHVVSQSELHVPNKDLLSVSSGVHRLLD